MLFYLPVQAGGRGGGNGRRGFPLLPLSTGCRCVLKDNIAEGYGLLLALLLGMSLQVLIECNCIYQLVVIILQLVPVAAEVGGRHLGERAGRGLPFRLIVIMVSILPCSNINHRLSTSGS